MQHARHAQVLHVGRLPEHFARQVQSRNGLSDDRWQVFYRVYLPMATPGLAILTVLAFNTHWNEFFRPFRLKLTISAPEPPRKARREKARRDGLMPKPLRRAGPRARCAYASRSGRGCR